MKKLNKKGSLDTTPILVFLICFWVVVTILSRYFDVTAMKTDIETLKVDDKTILEEEGDVLGNFFNDVFNTLESVPIVNAFVPLMRIMSFQYSDQIPEYLSIFLDVIAILSAFIVVSVFKK